MEKPKAKLGPCPYPELYDNGICCGGTCFADAKEVLREVRGILTTWNFGPMQDREALDRIHALVGDNVQGVPESADVDEAAARRLLNAIRDDAYIGDETELHAVLIDGHIDVLAAVKAVRHS